MGFTIDIDTGGTFTDGFVTLGEDYRLIKVPTTPHDFTQCFINCVAEAAKEFGRSTEELLAETDIVRFSNTIGTNTIIQRDGAKIGLIVTRGTSGLAKGGGEERRPLVEPAMIAELDEETGPDGAVSLQPDRGAVMEAAQLLIDSGARAIVVAFKNSDASAVNESLVRKWIKSEYPRDYLGSVPVFLASDVSPRAGSAERMNSAIINAYIHSKLSRLLYKADEDLRKLQYRRGLLVCHNNGSVARVAKTRAINTYNSGPSAGLLGASKVGGLYGFDEVITTDMGGTSFDIGLVRKGAASYSLRPNVEGFFCNLPMSSVLALGAGGGSIARIEEGELFVGPQSAGALPGPVAFDLGGDAPTVTDANLVLGYLDPEFFLGGAFPLHEAKAREAIKSQIGDPLGVGVEEAAQLIRSTIDQQMGSGVKKVMAGNGAANAVIVAYGGAGGLHCCAVAEAAGVEKTIITPFSSVSSAFSSSLMDIGHVYYRRVEQPLKQALSGRALDAAVAEMRAEAKRDMRGEGFDSDSCGSELQFFVAAGEAEVMVIAPEAALNDQAAAEELIADAKRLIASAGGDPDAALRLSTLGLSVSAPVPHFEITDGPEEGADASGAIKSRRSIFCPGAARRVEAPIYDHGALRRGMSFEGPAILESPKTSIVVNSGWRLTVDQKANYIIDRM